MKAIKKIFPVVLAIVLMANGSVFANDLVGHWGESEMIRFNRYGIVQGDEKGNMHPNKDMTRAEVFTMLAKMYGENIRVENGKPYYDKAVETLGAYGLIEKAQMTASYLNQPMSRGEVVMLFAKAFYLTPDLKNSEDVVQYFALEKYISGNEKGDLILNKTISRAEVVKILGNVFPNVLLGGQVIENKTFSGNVWLLGDEVSLKNTQISGRLILSPKNSATKKIAIERSAIGHLVVPPFYKGEVELNTLESKVDKFIGQGTIKLNGKKVTSSELPKLVEVAEQVKNSESSQTSVDPVVMAPIITQPVTKPKPEPKPEDTWVLQESLKWLQIEGSPYVIFELSKGNLSDYTLFSGESILNMTPINHDGTLVKALLKSMDALLSLRNSKGEVQSLVKKGEKPQALSKEGILVSPMGQKVTFTLSTGQLELDTVTGATAKGSTAMYHIGNMPLGVKAQVTPNSNGFMIEFMDERLEKTNVAFTAIFKLLTHSIKGVTPTDKQFDFEFKVQLGHEPAKPEVKELVKRITIEGVPYVIIDLNKDESILKVEIDDVAVKFTPINHSGSMVKIALTTQTYQKIQVITAINQYDIK